MSTENLTAVVDGSKLFGGRILEVQLYAEER